MNKEERAEKWFRHIPGEEKIPMETKIKLCGQVTLPLMLIFLGIYIAEFALLHFVDGGESIDRAAELINGLTRSRGGVHYWTLALTGMLMMLPLTILPVAVSFLFRRSWLSRQAAKVLSEQPRTANRGGKAETACPQQRADEKYYADWNMDADGRIQDGFSANAVIEQLDAMQSGRTEYLIFTPNELVKVEGSDSCCDFLQLCGDENPEFFHLEVGTVNPAEGRGNLIYGKNTLVKSEVRELLFHVMDGGSVPSLLSWEVVLDLRK